MKYHCQQIHCIVYNFTVNNVKRQSWVRISNEISCSKEENLTFLDQTPQRLLSILLQVSSMPAVRCIHLHQMVPKGGGRVTLAYNITKILRYFKNSKCPIH